jgi:hypothetical protein
MKEYIIGFLILVGLFIIFQKPIKAFWRKKKIKTDEKDTMATGLPLPPKPPKGEEPS